MPDKTKYKPHLLNTSDDTFMRDTYAEAFVEDVYNRTLAEVVKDLDDKAMAELGLDYSSIRTDSDAPFKPELLAQNKESKNG